MIPFFLYDMKGSERWAADNRYFYRFTYLDSNIFFSPHMTARIANVGDGKDRLRYLSHLNLQPLKCTLKKEAYFFIFRLV